MEIRKQKQTVIAAQLKISEVFVSRVKNGKRKTENEELAIALSKITKRRPIWFISPKLRKLYLRANPFLK